MSFDIIVRFPTEEVAKQFCGQMSDGFGEGFCNFHFEWERLPENDGTKQEHYKQILASAINVPLYTVNEIFEM